MRERVMRVAAVLMLFLLMGFEGLAHAQSTDARFEELSKELYPKAKQEGELTVYSIWDVQEMVLVLDAFSKQFPGIKTDYWQADNPSIVSRVITEFQGGKRSVDVLMTDQSMPVLKAAGTVMPYETVQKDALIFQDPTMPVLSLQVQALAYNTKKIKTEDLPKDWEDIANPKYKGIVALDDPMRAGPLSVQLAALKEHWKDDARFARFIRGLKALNVPIHRSTGAMFRLVISGEYSLAEPALLSDLIREKEKNTPVDRVISAPPIVFARYAGIYVKSPHPNAAKLFLEWMLTPAGQAVQDKVNKTANRKGFSGKSSIEASWPSDIKPIGVNDKEYLLDPKKWLETNVKPIWEGK